MTPPADIRPIDADPDDAWIALVRDVVLPRARARGNTALVALLERTLRAVGVEVVE